MTTEQSPTNMERLMQMGTQLRQWFVRVRRGRRPEIEIHPVRGSTANRGPRDKIEFHTRAHRYSIVFGPYENDSGGYLGCVASRRTPNPGEDWLRGNDLPDGPFCEQTWTNILSAIVGYELVSVTPEDVAADPSSLSTGAPSL